MTKDYVTCRGGSRVEVALAYMTTGSVPFAYAGTGL